MFDSLKVGLSLHLGCVHNKGEGRRTGSELRFSKQYHFAEHYSRKYLYFTKHTGNKCQKI